MKNMGKLFGTDGIRGKAGKYPMNAEMAMRVVMGAGRLRLMRLSLPDRTELAVRNARRRIERLGYREKPPDACCVDIGRARK